MDYLEFHISKDTAERAAFIGVILILLVVAIFSYMHVPGCSEVACADDAVPAKAAPVQAPPADPEPAAPEEVAAVEPVQTIEYVDMVLLKFAPKEVTIPVGGKVVFINKEPATAPKLYERKGYFYGPRMNPGESYNVTFDRVGTYVVLSIMGQKAGMEMKVFVT